MTKRTIDSEKSLMIYEKHKFAGIKEKHLEEDADILCQEMEAEWEADQKFFTKQRLRDRFKENKAYI